MAKFFKKKQFWGGLIAIVLLWYCVKDISIQELWSVRDRLVLPYFLLAVICSFIFIILRGLRWRLIISQQNSVKYVRSVTLYSAGQVLNIIMPALTGQVGRLILFAKKENLKKSFIFSTIVLEILFDSISLIVFVFLSSFVFPFPDEYKFIGYIIASVTAAVLIILYGILHFQTRFEEFTRRHYRHRWPSAYIVVKKFVRSFSKGIVLLKSSQHLIGSLVYSLAAWTVHILAIYFLCRAFSIHIPFAGATGLTAINTIVLMVPITPGNAGTFEIAVSTSLLAFSVTRTDSVLVALTLHVIDLLPIFALGMTFLHMDRLSLRKFSKEHEEEIIFNKISEEGVYVEEETI